MQGPDLRHSQFWVDEAQHSPQMRPVRFDRGFVCVDGRKVGAPKGIALPGRGGDLRLKIVDDLLALLLA
jgi:hypothetical protein